MNRDILHIRLDAFFATVEQRRRPNLRGKPVIVTEPKGNTSGVVVSASKEARKLLFPNPSRYDTWRDSNLGRDSNLARDSNPERNGNPRRDGNAWRDETRITVRHAQRACPDAILFKADYQAYRLVFNEFLDIMSQYTPQLEPDSLGSAYMDVTTGRNLFGDPSQLCARIISEVSARMDMPLLIGCAPNKLLAKIASGKGKWFIRVRPGGETDFLAPLPVSALDSVTSKIGKRLGELGISKIGELAQISEHVLARQFGPVGSLIHKQAHGIDFSPVKAAYPPEVIYTEHTFFCPLEEPSEVESYLTEMIAKSVAKLREKNLLAGEVMLAICDDVQKQISRSARSDAMPAYFTFRKPTDSTYTITQTLHKLLASLMKPGMEVSKVKIEFSGLTSGESSQLSLIGEGERGNRLNRVIELIADRFGDGTVFPAALLKPRRGSV